jgi:hypothetical protein
MASMPNTAAGRTACSRNRRWRRVRRYDATGSSWPLPLRMDLWTKSRLRLLFGVIGRTAVQRSRPRGGDPELPVARGPSDRIHRIERYCEFCEANKSRAAVNPRCGVSRSGGFLSGCPGIHTRERPWNLRHVWRKRGLLSFCSRVGCARCIEEVSITNQMTTFTAVDPHTGSTHHHFSVRANVDGDLASDRQGDSHAA